MRISVAQIKPVKGNIAVNGENHKKLIALAASFKSDGIFFPELSMTGFEPELAKELAISPDTKVLDEFQKISDKLRITIGIGMPTKTSAGIKISMLIFQANSTRKIYSKQLLHIDEVPYFINGESQVMITIGDKKIAPAICYESLQMEHASNANKLGAEIYLASVAKSQNGIDKAKLHYPSVARQFTMPVLMANCVGYCDNFLSAGQSAIWTKQGDIAGQLNNQAQGIITYDSLTERAVEHCIEI